MPDTTARLGLPIMAPAQAQKHVTHNEALLLLDGATQLVLDGIGTETPPATPTVGETHFLGAAPSGLWASESGALAQWQDTQWVFQAPQDGWRAWDVTGDRLVICKSSQWVPITDNLDGIGIGTGHDSTNRLSIASPASLFSHAGADHQMKINKSGAADTASLLFQSGWTGHAEMGLSGDTQFRIKVSADGTTWYDALVVDPAVGHVSGTAIQTDATDTTAGKLARADFAFGPGNLLGTVGETAGQPTGAVIEQGSNAQGSYVRFADGTQICWAEVDMDIDQAIGSLFWSGETQHDFPTPFATIPAGSGALHSSPSGWINGRAASATSWGFAGFATASTPAATAQLIAIGRWF